jgi:hypothetical protein
MPTLTLGNSQVEYNIGYRFSAKHVYDVKLLSGDWPSERELATLIDDRYEIFGGQTQLKETTGHVVIYVD